MFSTVHPRNFLPDHLTSLSRGMKREMTHFTSLSSSVVKCLSWKLKCCCLQLSSPSCFSILIMLYFPAPQTISGCLSLTFYIVLNPQTVFFVVVVVIVYHSHLCGSLTDAFCLRICMLCNKDNLPHLGGRRLDARHLHCCSRITRGLPCSDSLAQHNGSL